MSAYSEFFLSSRSDVIQYECLEISHSAFEEPFYLVRNATLGITATHEDDTEHEYEYTPMRFALSGARDDLEQILKVDLGDLGAFIPAQVDRIIAAGTLNEPPKVVYRTYRSDNLEEVLYGPINLEIITATFNKTGCSFEAKAPSLNVSKTGELYTLPRFTMLRGLL